MRLEFPWVVVPRQRRQLVPYRVAEQRLQRPPPKLRQLPNRADTDLGQPRLGDRAHSPHQLDREVVKEIELSLGIDDHQPVGFGHLRGDFREVLSARHSDRDWKSQLGPHAASNRFSNFSRRPKRWMQPATSAKASSMEIRSTRGVKSPNTAMAASPSRWYSLKWPLTKVRCGQSSRARRPDIPLQTPKDLAS